MGETVANRQHDKLHFVAALSAETKCRRALYILPIFELPSPTQRANDFPPCFAFWRAGLPFPILKVNVAIEPHSSLSFTPL